MDMFFNNISELLSFCCILTPKNFALNSLENEILQTSRQVCQLKDP